MLVGAVGLITEAEQARDILQLDEDDRSIGEEAEAAKEITDASGGKAPMADCILVARQFMREPEWVLKVRLPSFYTSVRRLLIPVGRLEARYRCRMAESVQPCAVPKIVRMH